MIRRFTFGNPIPTEAVVLNIEKRKAVPPIDESIAVMDGMAEIKRTVNGFIMKMRDEDIVYGLGENVRGINKRGWVYESNNSDEPKHEETRKSLYGSHNFIVIAGEKPSENYGLFIDTPGKVRFDIGYSKYDELKIEVIPADGDSEDYTSELNLDLYIIEEDTVLKTVKSFRGLVGKSYIAPKWAFGYGQSRWSYMSSDEVREVVKKHRDNHIPLDSLYLDIDYMDDFMDFTINPDTFADFKELVEDMKKEHIHLVPIIDAGVKVKEGYKVYDEGVQNGYFCKDENGEDFIVGVWPGKCVLPDMLNDEARAWFGNWYKVLLDLGIDGFWNDMNEPALFYSEKRLKKVFDEIGEYKNKNLDVNTFFEFSELAGSIANNPEDYKSFYHNYKGQKIRHDKVHNLFGYYMTRSASEAFKRLVPDKNILMYSRSSYIGMHRYAGIWQGDNRAFWSHLLMNIQMMPSLNMCGFLYTGADLGGFGDDTTSDLMIRWLSFGIFTPLMRNHSARGTRRQEVYQFDSKSMDMMSGIISLRYRLIHYLYDAYTKACEQDEMMFRPLGMDYPSDKDARRVEDQLMIGDAIMVAPVYTQNATGRSVYIPENMTMLRFKGAELVEKTSLTKGHTFIDMPLGEVCIFVREDKELKLADAGAEYVEE